MLNFVNQRLEVEVHTKTVTQQPFGYADLVMFSAVI